MPISKLRPSFTFTEDRLAELGAVVPEAVADGKVNWEALREALGAYLQDEGAGAEHFGLFWPGKREARRLAAKPSKGTLVPVPGEGVNEDTTRNIFIEGDNLEVLKILQKSYAARIKMIYIDPPYNTGNDFVYKDDYRDPLEDYLRKIGQVDEEGNILSTNSGAGGRFHSNWLSMMYSRLLLARQLLKESGVIFVSIDDHEVHNLRALLNEVFGEENFLATFVWKRRASSALAENLVSVDHEYVIAYQRGEFEGFRGNAKDYSNYKNPDGDPNGPWTLGDLTVGMTREQRPNQFYDLVDPATRRKYPANPNRVWSFIRESMADQIAAGRVVFPEDPSKRPMLKRYRANLQSEVNPVSTWIRSLNEPIEEADESVLLRSGLTAEGTRLLQNLFGTAVFNYSKPVSLLTSLIGQCTSGDDIVLDFFAGSATLGQAVLELNREDGERRRYILVQLPEPSERSQFATVADIGKERLRLVAKQLAPMKRSQLPLRVQASFKDIGLRVYELARSSFKAWEDYAGDDVHQLELAFESIGAPLIEGWKAENLRIEVQLLEGFPLDSTVTILDDHKKNRVQLVVSDTCAHRLLVCLDKEINDATFERLQMEPDDVFVCLDSALTDEAKVRLGDLGKLRVI